MPGEYLLSPMRRRLASKVKLGKQGIQQLRKLGWTDYEGPAHVTLSKKHPARTGWVVPGTDPDIDQERMDRTGTMLLGTPIVE